MRMMRHLNFIVVAGLLAGCVASTDQSQSRYTAMQQAADEYESRLEECTAIHGYDPDNPGNLGPNQLAPTERNWANCVYDGLRATLMLETTQPRLYDAIIAEHRVMTDKVESGLMTRSERRARMLELREDLRQKEIARVSAEAESEQIPDGVMDMIRYSSFQSTAF